MDLTGPAVLLWLCAAAGVYLILEARFWRIAASRQRRPGRLGILIVESRLPDGPAGLFLLFLSATILGLIGYLATSAWLGIRAAAVAVAIGAVSTPFVMLHRQARARNAARHEAWPEAVDVVVSAIRSGDSLPQAVASLASRGPVPLRPAFATFAGEYAATADFSGTLGRVRGRLNDPIADRVASALLLAQRVGGRELVRVLLTLAAFTREDLASRKEIAARQSWTVSGARAAAAAPWLIFLLFSTRPSALAAFLTPAGNVLIACGAVTTFVGYRLMVFLGRVPREADAQ